MTPRRLLLECPPHQRCTVGVEFDGADLAAQLIALGDVEVADGRFPVGIGEHAQEL